MKEHMRELNEEELGQVSAGVKYMVGDDDMVIGENVKKRATAMAYGIAIDIVQLLPDDPDTSDEEYMDKAYILDTAVKSYMEESGMTREQAIQTAKTVFGL